MTGFFVYPLTKENIDTAIQAILPYEQTCVNLADCLRRQKDFFDKGTDCFTFSKCFIFLSSSQNTESINEENSFLGVLLISARLVLLHCFPKGISQNIANHISEFILTGINIACIMGEKNNTAVLEEAVDKTLLKKNVRAENYNLMELYSLKPNTFYEAACNHLNFQIEIVKPQANEAEKICPMEINYMRDEVLAKGEQPLYNTCLSLIKRRIQKGVLAAVKKEGTFIAKAVINASGFFWKQIGGVYTLPQYRNCSVAAALVCKLIEICDEEKQKTALFVKMRNYAAQRLYEKIGFVKTCEFRIVYF